MFSETVGGRNTVVCGDEEGAAGTIKFATVSAVDLHACGITTEGKAYCWGAGGNGQLGNGGTANSLTPAAVNTSGALAGKTLTELQTGSATTCALDSENKAYCWGLGTSGQLGNDASATSTLPVAVNLTGVLEGKILKTLGVACAVDTEGEAYGWGAGIYGQLGNRLTRHSNVPVKADVSGVE